MKTWNKWIFLLVIFAGMLGGCKDEPIEDVIEEAPEVTQKVNEFIEVVMKRDYLWYKEMPEIDTRYEFDSKEYFKKLLNSEDKWSVITSNAQESSDSSHGIEKSFGYSLVRGRFTNTENYFAIVEYVYPDSPADVAGLTRGDFIIKIDGQPISNSNYQQLWNADNLNITTGIYSTAGISPGNTISMTSRELELDPVLIYKTIETEGHIIGYLFYAQFIPDFNSSLQQAFQFFKDKNITDLVVDLRYNPGGYISAAQFLCSSIAPSTITSGTTLITMQFSDKYTPVKWPFLSQSQALQPVKLGLNKVYFLTGQGSASASELTITGLDPYMDVVMVGDTTYGKYTASLFYTPDSVYTDKNYTKDMANWGIQPIIARYANANGVTDFKNGFAPDFYVNEYSAENMPFLPLGEPNEPLLKEAIADITGIPVLATKKAATHFPFAIVDRGFSKYDASKRNLMIDSFEPIK